MDDADESMRSLATEEYQQLSTALSDLQSKTFPKLLLQSSHQTSHISALVELKVGVGGEEAGLFVADLMRMYLRYATVWGEELSNRALRTGEDEDGTSARGGGWTTNVISENKLDTRPGAFKDVIIEIKGPGSYDNLKWETGVHRVQRVPATESSGRLHTSAVAVAVRRVPKGFSTCYSS